mmetsp:Transcript_13612/g.49487  ORF Transcript_13612/g.49487 Transcript_13612/m.49487 type:complete len:160 (-) Transcript_13612:61-540(-)
MDRTSSWFSCHWLRCLCTCKCRLMRFVCANSWLTGRCAVCLHIRFQTGALDALQRRLNPPHVRPQVSGQQDSQGSEQERGQDGTGEGNHPQQQHLAQPAAQSPPTTGFMAFAMEVQTIVLGFVTSLLPGWHNDGPQVQPVRQGGVAGVADLRAQGVDDN